MSSTTTSFVIGLPKGCLQTSYGTTKDEMADIFTEGLSHLQHSAFSSKLTLTLTPLSLPGSVTATLPPPIDPDFIGILG